MKFSKLFKKQLKITDWLVVLVSLLVIYSALVYFSYSLNTLGIVLSVILALTTFVTLFKYKLLEVRAVHKNSKTGSIPRPEDREIFALISYLLFIFAAFLELFKGRTAAPLISPFEAINISSFFLFYILSLVTLILIIKRGYYSDKLKIKLISLHLFLSLGLALIVYKIAYGFDPFIHLAAVETIVKHGVIYPKTPYYLGQYGLITTLVRLSGLSASIISKLLVPLSAALILPKLALSFFKNLSLDNGRDSSVALISTLVVLTFIFPLFIISTPQNFAYLFLLLTIYSAISQKPRAYTAIFALAAAAIHPIAGIPAIIWSLWLMFKDKQVDLSAKADKFISASLLAAGALIIPLALFISSGARWQNLKLNFHSIWIALKSLFVISYSGSQDFVLNAVYLVSAYYQFILLGLLVFGIFLFFNNKTKLHYHDKSSFIWRGLLSINLSLIGAYILSSQINFSDIIAYEQNDFASRIITIIILFSSPFIALAVYYVINKINKLPKFRARQIFYALIIFFITSSLYLAYPRFDNYRNSRGYSTSSYDLEAVSKIDSLSSGKYLVLANQQVSAAALAVFGFDNYLMSPEGQLYFYPIPTGGVLYQYYLNMVYKEPSRKTMTEVMELTGTKESYLVVNKYWHDSSKIIKAAKLSADTWHALENNNIFIFQYLK